MFFSSPGKREFFDLLKHDKAIIFNCKAVLLHPLLVVGYSYIRDRYSYTHEGKLSIKLPCYGLILSFNRVHKYNKLIFTFMSDKSNAIAPQLLPLCVRFVHRSDLPESTYWDRLIMMYKYMKNNPTGFCNIAGRLNTQFSYKEVLQSVEDYYKKHTRYSFDTA